MVHGRALLAACLASALLSAPAAAAPAPNITSSDPKSVYQNFGSLVDVALYGTNFIMPGETAATFSANVKLLARRNGRPFADVSKDIKGWSPGRLDIEFDSGEFDLQKPGTLEFAVSVKGVQSNTLVLPIDPYPSTPPSISSIGPKTFATNLPLQRNYLFRIDAKNTPDDTKVTIDGEQVTFFAFADFAGGSIDVYVPEDLRAHPGSYPVVLSSRSGASNAVTLRIRDPLAAGKPSVAKMVAQQPPMVTQTSSARNPFAGVTPVPAAPATPAAQTAAPAKPFKLDPSVMQRYQSMAAILLPSLRGAIDPIVSTEVSAMRAGPADPDFIAITAIRTLRPDATGQQQRVLEGYVLANALNTLGASDDPSQPRSATLDENERKAFGSLGNIMKKFSETADTSVQTLR